MLPDRMSFSSNRATICSDVRPSGMVSWCWTTLPSTMVSTTSRTLACFWKRYSPALRPARAFSANTPPTKMSRCSSMTPSALEQIRDVHHAGARRDVDHLVLLQRTRRFESCLANDRGRPTDEQDEREDGEYGIADDHKRIARTPGWTERTGGQRHVIRLQSSARAARRDAFELHQRTGCSLRSPGHGRFWLVRAKRHPSGRGRRCRKLAVQVSRRPKPA